MNCNDTKATILILEPNSGGRAFLADNLAADGFEPVVASTQSAAWQLLAGTAVDLAIIDIGERPGLDSLDTIRSARRRGERVDPDMPVIVLSPRATEVERLRAFDHGADDLLNLPYSYPELRARIGAILRRTQLGRSPTRLRIGPLEIDIFARQAWLDGRALTLAGKEFALLAALARDPSRCLAREYLLEKVWGYGANDRTRTVDAHASRLRRKLSHPDVPFVICVRGSGYRLISATSTEAAPERPQLALVA